MRKPNSNKASRQQKQSSAWMQWMKELARRPVASKAYLALKPFVA